VIQSATRSDPWERSIAQKLLLFTLEH
jgi:hypothetical protein